jgi:hypothetical protein
MIQHRAPLPVIVGIPAKKTPIDPNDPTPIEILSDMCQAFRIDPIQITSILRSEERVKYRRIYCYLANVLSSASSDEKAAIINKDRGTYYHHAKKCADWFESNDREFMASWSIYLENSKLWSRHFKRKQQYNGSHTECI